MAIADLAKRLGVDASAISLVSSTADEFPAGDLGCPDPKTPSRPLDAIVTGQRLLLEYQEARYEYHLHASQFAYCGDVKQ